MFFIIFIVCIIMFFLYNLYKILKVRYAVRKFFELAIEVEQLYGLYTLAGHGEINPQRFKVSFKIEFTEEDIEELLKLSEAAILCCDENYLLDFEEPTVIKTYTELKNISIELRRCLWINNTNQKED